MFTPPRLFRLHIESLREGRLIYEQPKVRTLEREPSLFERLADDQASVEDLEDLEEAVIGIPEQSDVYKAMEAEGKTYTEPQRRVIDMNLNRLAERAAKRPEVLKKITALRSAFTRPAQAPVSTSSPPRLRSGPSAGARMEEPSATSSEEKAWYAKSWEWTKDKSEKTAKWAGEHPVEALAVGSTLTLGVYSLYRLWKWWRGEKKEEGKEAEKKKGSGWFWKMMLGIPVVGLLGWGIYEGAQWMRKNLGSVEQAQKLLADAKEEAKKILGSAKEGAKHLADHALGKQEGEKYKLSEENYHFSVKAYRETRAHPDEKRIKQFFNLGEGQSSAEYVSFMQDMHAKYDVLPLENGITYARADAALENYEESMGAVLHQFLEWFRAHPIEEMAFAFVVYKAGLLNIRTILHAGTAVAKTAAGVATEIGKMGLRHPIASLLGLGGAFLTERAVIAASKKTYLPENFTEIGKVLAGNQDVVKGGSLPPLVSASLESGRDDLKTLTGSFSEWISSSFDTFTDVVLNKLPELGALKKWETVKHIHTGSLNSLKTELQSRISEVTTTTEQTGLGTGPLLTEALTALQVFQDAFFAHRTEQVTQSDEPERALAHLRDILTQLKISTVEEDGVIRWEAPDGTWVDLCVDPSIRDPERIHEVSKHMREVRGLNDHNYVALRGFYHLREKYGRLMERGDWGLPGGKVAAVLAGGAIYFTDPENQEEFWTAPVRLIAELFPGTSWTEFGADFAEAAGNSAILTLNVAVFAQLKRVIVGGASILQKRTIFEMGWAVNPITAPIKLVRDVARGVVDISVARHLRTLTGESGRMANVLFGRAGIRPEWFGIIDNSMDIDELKYVAKMMREGNIEGKGLDELRTLLQKSMVKKIEKIHWRPLRRIFEKTHIRNYDDLKNAIGLWYTDRTGTARVAERVAKAADQTLDVVRMASSKLYDAIALVLKEESGGIAIDKIMEVLSKVKIPPALIEAFAKSKGAVVMLVNAVRNGGVPAVEYLVKLATIAKKIAPIAGKAALGLDALICVVEIAMNRARIAGTDNQSLKELYAMQDRMSVANAVAGTAMGVTWLAVGWAPASTAAYAVGASTFLPAVVAFSAGKYLHGKAEEVSETWLSEQKDWEKKKPGELRLKMEALGPGQRTYWQGWAGGTRAENWGRWVGMKGENYRAWQQENENRIQEANAGQRFKVVRAYAAKMTDLPMQSGESEQAYGKRFDRFQQDQHDYLRRSTQGRFDATLIMEYQAAHIHAELMTLSRSLQAKRCSRVIRLIKTDEAGNPKEFDLARYTEFQDLKTPIDGVLPLDVIFAYRNDQRTETILRMAAMRKIASGDKTMLALQDSELQNVLLSEVRYDLSLCDRNLREYENVAQLPGWEWTGGLDGARNTARHGLTIELRSLIRDQAHWLRAKPDATAADVTASVEKISTLLQSPKLFRRFYDVGAQKSNIKNLEKPEDSEVMLTLPWLRQHLYVDASPTSKAQVAALPSKPAAGMNPAESQETLAA